MSAAAESGARIIRVFISSTFTDFVPERDILHAQVFPDLEAYCAGQGWRFVPVDLRWGIGPAAARFQQTIEICEREVYRSQAVTPKPNFLLLLGDRAGWAPLPSDVPADDMERVLSHLSPEDLALATAWYQPDVNATPPRWSLRARSGRHLDAQVWFTEVETPLHAALREAAVKADLPEDRAALFLRSATEAEVHVGLFGPTGTPEGCVTCLRDAPFTPDAVRAKLFDDDADAERRRARLKVLRGRVEAVTPPDYLYRYAVEVTEAGVGTGHLEAFAKAVWLRLKASIDARIAEFEARPAELAPPPRLFDRSADALAVRRVLDGPEPLTPLVVGEAGVGRSALLRQLAFAGGRGETHLLELGEDAGAARDLRGLVDRLAVSLGIDLKTGSARARLQRLWEVIVTEKRTIVLLIDDAHLLDPGVLFQILVGRPDGVRLALSAREDSRLHLAVSGDPRFRIRRLTRLGSSAGRQLISHRLSAADRTLQPGQWAALQTVLEAGATPAYLHLLASDLARLRSDETIGDVPPDMTGLLRRFLSDVSEPDVFGDLLAPRVLAFLALSDQGLAEEELLAVLGVDDELVSSIRAASYFDPPSNGKGGATLPTMIWARLRYELEPLLRWRPREGRLVLTLGTNALVEFAETAFTTEALRRRLHGLLAEMFRAQRPEELGRRWSQRALQQLPRHLRLAGRWDDLRALLGDIGFIMEVCDAGALSAVIAEYRLAVALGCADRAWLDVLCRAQPVIERPGSPHRVALTLLQQALQLPPAHPVAQQARAHIEANQYFPLLVAPPEPAGETPRARLTCPGGCRGFELLPTGRAVTWSEDATVRLWSIVDGTLLSELAHDAFVTGVAPLGGEDVLTWTLDRISHWRAEAGELLWAAPVPELAGALAMDTFVLTWSRGGDLTTWRTLDGARIATHRLGAAVRWAEPCGDGVMVHAGETTYRLASDLEPKVVPLAAGPHTRFVAVSGTVAVLAHGVYVVSVDLAGSDGVAFSVGHVRDIDEVVPMGEGLFVSWSQLSPDLAIWREAGGLAYHAKTVSHGAAVAGVKALGDNRFASWDVNGEIGVWRARVRQSGDPLVMSAVEARQVRIIDTDLTVSDVTALPGEQLCVSTDEGRIRIYDLQTATCIRDIAASWGPLGRVLAIDDAVIAWSFHADAVTVWPTLGPAPAPSARREGYPLEACRLAPGEIAISGSNGAVTVWQAATGRTWTAMAGGERAARGLLAWSGDALLIRTWDGAVDVIDPGAGAVHRLLPAESGASRYLLDLGGGRLAAWTPGEGHIEVHDVNRVAPVTRLRAPGRGRGEASIDTAGNLTVRSGNTIETIWSDRLSRARRPSWFGSVVGRHRGTVLGSGLMDDGTFVSWSERGELVAWRPDRRRPAKTLDLPAGLTGGAICGPWVAVWRGADIQLFTSDLSRASAWSAGGEIALAAGNRWGHVIVLTQSGAIEWGVDDDERWSIKLRRPHGLGARFIGRNAWLAWTADQVVLGDSLGARSVGHDIAACVVSADTAFTASGADVTKWSLGRDGVQKAGGWRGDEPVLYLVEADPPGQVNCVTAGGVVIPLALSHATPAAD